MIVCPQIEITEPMILATNLTETDAPVYNAGTTYGLGGKVMYDHAVFESLQAANIGKTPGDKANAGWWLRIGSTNKFKPFEFEFQHIRINSDRCINSSTITYQVKPDELVSALGFFGLEGVESIAVTQTDPVEGVVLDQTIDLSDDTDIIDMWSFLYTDFEYDTERVIFDIRPYPSSTFDITLTGTGTIGVGQIVFGNAREVGITVYGTSIGTKNYDVVEQNTFGEYTNVIDRGYSRLVDFDMRYQTDSGRRIQRFLDGLRLQGAIYLAAEGTERFGTTVFGRYKQFLLNHTSPSISEGTIEVETFK